VTGLRYVTKEEVRTRWEETRGLRARAEMASRIHDTRYHKIYVLSSII
jgi:hypothetical protein